MSALGRNWRKRFDERGLPWLFAAFFLALAVPAALLVAQAYGQLKWEALRTTQTERNRALALVRYGAVAIPGAGVYRATGSPSAGMCGKAGRALISCSPL